MTRILLVFRFCYACVGWKKGKFSFTILWCWHISAMSYASRSMGTNAFPHTKTEKKKKQNKTLQLSPQVKRMQIYLLLITVNLRHTYTSVIRTGSRQRIRFPDTTSHAQQRLIAAFLPFPPTQAVLFLVWHKKSSRALMLQRTKL